ncbi:MAG: hypothetical protein WCK51_01625 [Armatimonadota bacterium]
MEESPLLQETHALLKQLLQLEADQRAEAERARKEFEEKFSKPLIEKQDEAENAELSIKASQERMKAQMEETRKKEEEFRAAVVAEYQEQTRLLKEILELVQK